MFKKILVCCILLLLPEILTSEDPINVLKKTQAGGFEYFHYGKDGKPVWKLTGKEPVFLENDAIQIQKPILTFFEKQMKTSSVSSEKAILDGEKKFCKMLGDVKAKNLEGFNFNSHEMLFNMKENFLTFPSSFKILHEEVSVKANSGSFDIDQKKLKTEGKSKLIYVQK